MLSKIKVVLKRKVYRDVTNTWETLPDLAIVVNKDEVIRLKKLGMRNG